MGFVRVTNSKTKGEGVVSEGALPFLESKGWKRTDPKAAPFDAPQEVPAPKTKES